MTIEERRIFHTRTRARVSERAIWHEHTISQRLFFSS